MSGFIEKFEDVLLYPRLLYSSMLLWDIEEAKIAYCGKIGCVGSAYVHAELSRLRIVPPE